MKHPFIKGDIVIYSFGKKEYKYIYICQKHNDSRISILTDDNGEHYEVWTDSLRVFIDNNHVDAVVINDFNMQLEIKFNVC